MLRREREAAVWQHPGVRKSKARILSISVLTTVLFGVLVVLFYVPGLIPFFIPTGIGWPAYGAILHVGQSVMFGVGFAADESEATGFLAILAFLATLLLGMDVLGVTSLVWWLYAYYVTGDLTAAQIAALPVVSGVFATTLVVLVMVVFDLVNVLSYIAVLRRVSYIRENMEEDLREAAAQQQPMGAMRR